VTDKQALSRRARSSWCGLLRRAPRADFFYSMLNLRLPIALALMAAAYLLSFMLWALIWHSVYWCPTPTLTLHGARHAPCCPSSCGR